MEKILKGSIVCVSKKKGSIVWELKVIFLVVDTYRTFLGRGPYPAQFLCFRSSGID